MTSGAVTIEGGMLLLTTGYGRNPGRLEGRHTRQGRRIRVVGRLRGERERTDGGK